jgi:hypothetical protein
MSRSLVFIFLLFGFLSLAAGWTLAGFWPLSLVLLLFLPLSLFAVKRKFPPALSLTLALLVLTSAVGLWRGLNVFLALTVVCCALAAWDLESFSLRLAEVPPLDQPEQVERRHLLGLGLVCLLAVALAGLAQVVRIQASFENAFLLALLAFGGLAALINWLKTREG